MKVKTVITTTRTTTKATANSVFVNWKETIRSVWLCMLVFKLSTTRITDRRQERALAANPVFEKPGESRLKCGAAVRVHPIVGLPPH